MFYDLIRPLLFHLDPECAHRLTLKTLKLLCRPWLLRVIRKRLLQKPVQILGLKFPNPVGIAAGFDKNGECIDALLNLGFGFIEVGTVTPRPQQGNPRPRLYRIPEANALINRMGFNNLGVDYLVQQLKARRVPGIVGANIGMNRDTPFERASDDYCHCLNKLYPYVDYVVINVSSPNTPGLRKLQFDHYLEQLLEKIVDTRQQLITKYAIKLPLLLKISIDLNPEELKSIINVVKQYQLDGVVTSNTSVDHSQVAQFRYGDEAGGLSGHPINHSVVEMVARIADITDGQLPIIAVGGIFSAEDAKRCLNAGASLVQIYTGLVYRGPSLLKEIINQL